MLSTDNKTIFVLDSQNRIHKIEDESHIIDSIDDRTMTWGITHQNSIIKAIVKDQDTLIIKSPKDSIEIPYLEEFIEIAPSHDNKKFALISEDGSLWIAQPNTGHQ